MIHSSCVEKTISLELVHRQCFKGWLAVSIRLGMQRFYLWKDYSLIRKSFGVVAGEEIGIKAHHVHRMDTNYLPSRRKARTADSEEGSLFQIFVFPVHN